MVSGLTGGQTVRVYAEPALQTLLADASVASGDTGVSLRLSPQSVPAGIVYVTLTNPGFKESEPVTKMLANAPATPPPDRRGLKPGDEVRLYADRTAPEVMRTLNGDLAAANAALGETSVTIRQLQLMPKGGRLYVTVTSRGQRESQRVGKLYDAE